LAESTASKRRIGAASSETRAAIIRAAEAVIREEGYAAASSRRVALRAGLKPSLVHYYFPTTDDLYLAVFRQGAAQSDAMIEAAINSGDPLRSLWAFFSDTSRTALSVEFIALAIHRPAVRAEIAKHSEKMRAAQEKLIGDLLAEKPRIEGKIPAGVSVILAGIGRALMMEDALGVTSGHEDARVWVSDWIDQLLGKD
jgi:AcrR family transcriptional regulator